LDVDFKDTQAFQKVAQHLIDHAQEQAVRLDLLVVDESQDMQPEWVEAIFQRLKPQGRLYVLGDPDQNLYARESFDLPNAVRIHCMENFRSPGNIVQTLNAFKLSSQPVQARLPWKGSEPGFHVYHGDDCSKELGRVVQALIADGFAADQIALVTFAGREKSKILSKGRIADIAVRQFTGGHDIAGNESWSEGDLLVETLYRFKGQSAPAIVLCEVDFEQLTQREIRKLFVGVTRAQIRLEVVLSERAETLLAARLT
jgi:superfamily I DNA and RNA helicase